jgi:putative tricarboxylic transport membrane protein
MKLQAARGEIILSLAFVGVGIFWIVTALRLPLWDGFAPSSGFLPLVYGAALIGLSLGALLLESHGSDPSAEAAGPIGRPVMVIAALAVGTAGVEPAGFAAAMFVTMLFLFTIAEKLPVVPSLLASVGTTLVLTLVFRTWLGVPLPSGPWGF